MSPYFEVLTLRQFLQVNMSNPIGEGVNTIETSDETRSLNRQEHADVNSAGSSQSTRVTSKEIGRQIRAVTDPSSKHLELLNGLIRDL